MGIIKTAKLLYEYIRYDDDGNPCGSSKALEDINIDIEPGSFVAILGHNGSGKSTLAKHFNALFLPKEGTVWVDAKETAKEEYLWDIRQTTGMVFQNPDNQIVGNIVEEDVGFGPENMGIPTEEIWKRVDRAIENVGMQAYRLKSPNMLSGGQKQRVAIAGVMAMKPKCIVLDEPTAMLDPNGRMEVIRTLHELNKAEGITIVLITHYMEETIDADRLIVMKKGQVVMDGTPRTIFSKVEELYECGLCVPQVTELTYELRKAGVPLPEGIISIEEFADEYTKLVKNGTYSPKLKRRIEAFDYANAQESESEQKDANVQGTEPDPAAKQLFKASENGRNHDVILETKDLTFSYQAGTIQETHALLNVNLSIRPGEFIGLAGHTGSGKSTLIQHLNGLVKPTSGSVYFKGEDIHEKNYPMRALRQRVGLVFQYPEHQLFEETVLKDVEFGPKNLGMSKEAARECAIEALRLVKLDEKYYDGSPFDLSGGQKRRVAIAGVLAMNPEVLILDEPTAGLDPVGRDEILNAVSSLRDERGISIILVSHSMEDISRYADRIIVMSKGEKIFDDTPRNVFTKEMDSLQGIGLAAPQVAYIMKEINSRGVNVDESCITIREAVHCLS